MKSGQYVPLRWPTNEPRTLQPRVSPFSADRTLTQAVHALVDELEIKGFADGVVVSAGFGTAAVPRANEDHGAAVYFTRTSATLGARVAGDLRSPTGKIPYVLACDTFTHVADNVWALKKHVEAIRMMERNGVGTTEQLLKGFAQLPPSKDANPHAVPHVIRPWREVLGFNSPIYESGRIVQPNVDEVNARHRARLIVIRQAHPAGDDPAEPILNNARDEAIAELTSSRSGGRRA